MKKIWQALFSRPEKFEGLELPYKAQGVFEGVPVPFDPEFVQASVTRRRENQYLHNPCAMCGEPSLHKVGENTSDELSGLGSMARLCFSRHGLTNFYCTKHFLEVMSPVRKLD